MTSRPRCSTAGPGSGLGSAPGSGLGGATTQPLDRPKRRELTWSSGTDFGLVLLRFAVGGVVFAHGMQHVFGLWGGIGLPGLSSALTGFRVPEREPAGVGDGADRAGGRCGGRPRASSRRWPPPACWRLMINAVLLKAANGFFIAGPPGAGAVELEVVLGLGAAALLLTGAGRIALEKGRTWNRRPAPVGRAVPDHRGGGGPAGVLPAAPALRQPLHHVAARGAARPQGTRRTAPVCALVASAA